MVVVVVVVRACVPQRVEQSSSTMWVLVISLKGKCCYPLNHLPALHHFLKSTQLIK